jgi:hypothetical protein
VTRGGTGAPVIDSRGKIRGMISVGIDKGLVQYLLGEGLLMKPLEKITHGTNFACAPTIYDTETLNYIECHRDLIYERIDLIRSNMLSPVTLFTEMKRKLEAELESKSKFVNFGVELISNGDRQTAKIVPKCFKSVNGWISGLNDVRNNYVFDVKLPVQTFRRIMDSKGRIQGIVEEEDEMKYYLQFSLKSIRSNKSSTIYMWNDSSNETFKNIKENCSLL